MDHDLKLFIPILEILEIEVCNILCKPGNIGKHIFSTQFYPGNSGSYDPYISPMLEILDRTIHIYQSYVDVPGVAGGRPAKTDKMRDPCRGFWRRPTPIVSFDRTHPCPEYCNWFSPGGNSPKHVWRLLAFYFSMFLGGVVV